MKVHNPFSFLDSLLQKDSDANELIDDLIRVILESISQSFLSLREGNMI